MINYKIGVFCLLFSLFLHCGRGEKDLDAKGDLFDYRMALINEPNYKDNGRIFFRIGVSYSNFQEGYIFGIVDHGNNYLVYEKVLEPPAWKIYESRGKLVSRNEYTISIDSLVVLVDRLTIDKTSERETSTINDGGTWFVDYRIESTYYNYHGILLDDIETLRNMFSMEPFRFPSFGYGVE